MTSSDFRNPIKQWLAGILASILGGYGLWYLTIREETININVNGAWQSNHGCLILSQKGNYVSGSINYSDGKTGNISGSLKGRTLDYKYGHSEDSGSGTIIFSPSDSNARGHWKSERWQKEGQWTISRGCN